MAGKKPGWQKTYIYEKTKEIKKGKNKYQEYLDHLKSEEAMKSFDKIIKDIDERVRKEAIEKGYTEDWKTRTE